MIFHRYLTLLVGQSVKEIMSMSLTSKTQAFNGNHIARPRHGAFLRPSPPKIRKDKDKVAEGARMYGDVGVRESYLGYPLVFFGENPTINGHVQ